MPHPYVARRGDTARRASVGSAWASAPLLHPLAMSVRHAVRPRPWRIPSNTAPAARAQTRCQKVPKGAKKCHMVSLSPPWRVALGPAGSVLGRMAGFGRNLKLPKTLPKAAKTCHPPAQTILEPSARKLGFMPGRRSNSVGIEFVVKFGDLGPLWFALVTSGRRIGGRFRQPLGGNPRLRRLRAGFGSDQFVVSRSRVSPKRCGINPQITKNLTAGLIPV